MKKMRVGFLGVIIIAVFTTGLDLQGMHFFGVGIASLNLWSVLGCVFTAFSWAITAVVIAEGIYKRWLWKFNFLLGIPDLRTKSDVVLEFSHNLIQVQGGAAVEDGLRRKVAKVSIIQHATDIKMFLMTDQQESKVMLGELVRDKDSKKYDFYYIYRTSSRDKHVYSYPDQFGACRARYDEVYDCWVGDYWTDSLTRGKIYFADKETVDKAEQNSPKDIIWM